MSWFSDCGSSIFFLFVKNAENKEIRFWELYVSFIYDKFVKSIHLLFQINYLFFYHDSENPCFYSNNQKYKSRRL